MQHMIRARWGREWRVWQIHKQRAKGVTISTDIIKSKLSLLSATWYWMHIWPFCAHFAWYCMHILRFWGGGGNWIFKSSIKGCFDGSSVHFLPWNEWTSWILLPSSWGIYLINDLVWMRLQESQKAAWQGILSLGYFITYYYLCFCWLVSFSSIFCFVWLQFLAVGWFNFFNLF